MKKTGIKIMAVALVAAALASCKAKPKDDVKDNAEVEALFAVNTYKTKAGNLDEYLEFGGDVAAVSSVAALPDMAGKISRVMVSVGQMVKKNQVLAYVDASRPGMDYSASPVKAPISGRVISFIPSIGTMVSQASVVAEIADTDELEIKVSVAERFISRISLGQNAVVTFDAYPGVDFKAKVFEVSPVLDQSSRTMSVKLKINPPDKRIKAGMYARVRLITESIKDAIVVPAAAIVKRDGAPYLFVIASQKNGDTPAKVKLCPVEQGILVDNKTEITKGLIAGDEIVVKGQNLLNDGANVNIVAVTEN
ncbi:MAG: efflux RND transporter periplasmic adaptor subunit [Treponema sp.]|nr:efflux RND transporter periplasmic adaptor subunit [Treponema sp.]